MFILEAVFCDAVELYYVILRGVSNMFSTLIDFNGMGKCLTVL